MNTNTDKTPDYGEPWWKKGQYTVEPILDRNGDAVDEDERAIKCVNACAGMADPAAELAAMREAIKEAHAALKDACAYPVCGSWNEQAEVALTKLQPFIK